MTATGAHSEGLTCRDAIGILADYLESALSPEALRELEEHFAGCEPCRVYLRTYQRTRALTAATERVAMPDEMKDRLRQYLLRALRDG